MLYQPPNLEDSGYPDRDKGFDVQCPGSANRNTSVSARKLRLNKSDPMVSRILCMSKPYKEVCELCPNSNFEFVLEDIGSEIDFDWLKPVIKMIKSGVGAELRTLTRKRGDCCIDHKDTVLQTMMFEADPSSVIDRDTGKQVYSLIMSASAVEGVRFEVVHVKMKKRSQTEFEIVVAMKPM